MSIPGFTWGTQDLTSLLGGDPRWYAVPNVGLLYPTMVAESQEVLAAVTEEVAPIVSTVGQLIEAVAELVPFFATLPTIPVEVVLSEITKILSDLSNTGLYMLFLGPQAGGSQRLSNRFVKSLLNPDDENRPLFTSAGVIGSLTLVAGAPQFDAVAKVFDSLANLIGRTSLATRNSTFNQVTTVANAPYTNYFYSNLKYKNKALYDYWLRVTLLNQPYVEETMKRMFTKMDGIRQWATRNGFEVFAILLLQQITDLLEIIALYQQFLNDLNQFLSAGPLSALLIPPMAGGTLAWRQTVVDSLAGSHGGPIFGDSTFVSGLTIAIGGANSAEANSAWEALMMFYYAALQEAAPPSKIGP